MQLEDEKTPVNATTDDDDSFLRGGPVFSTPLVRDPTNVALPVADEDESWTASIESPFERLGRQVKDLALEDKADYPSTSDAPSFSPLHGSYTTLPNISATDTTFSDSETTMHPIPRSLKKGKSPLRNDVLRQNAALAAASTGSSTPALPKRTPRREKTPKNPFLPPNSVSRQWNGLVDLRQPSPARSKNPRTPEPPAEYDSDSSDDLMPPGMSPPVTMQFALPNRLRSSPVKLGLTPARKAAERIGQELIASAASRGIGSSRRLPESSYRAQHDPSISSVAPSLPSLTRYSTRPLGETSLNSNPATNSSLFKEPSLQSRPPPKLFPDDAAPASDTASSSEGDPPYSIPNPHLLRVDEGVPPSPGSDSDSSEHGESNPSAGFLFATQNNVRSANDSFGSSQHSFSSDEDDLDEAAKAARHPLAHMFVNQNADVVDDSFDDSFVGEQRDGGEDEDTVFGARQVGQLPPGQRQFMLRSDPLNDATHTGAVSLNRFAQVEQTPTPYIPPPGEKRMGK